MKWRYLKVIECGIEVDEVYVGIAKKPEWIQRAITNENARKRYHLKKYGNLDKLQEKEWRKEQEIDDSEFDEA